jgi:glyoxylase-like metal-dependent hydrolase (beta-lactamase superfamily II)
VLVDTGLGTGDIANPGQLGRPFRAMIRPQLRESETAVAQVRALGFDPADVHHIIATHLDLDHSGGLPDFPVAKVHLLTAERDAAMKPTTREGLRYIPAHWPHNPRWATHDSGAGGDEWFGFESVRVLPGSEVEILLIPLPGHSRGHTGVAIRRPDGWLLHCGDAFFFHGEVENPPRCPLGLRVFQTLTQSDGKARRQNQERLRELAQRHGDEVELICSHDPFTLDRLADSSP